MPKYVLLDRSDVIVKGWVQRIKQIDQSKYLKGIHLDIKLADIVDFVKNTLNITYIISPANSQGLLTGGIDLIFRDVLFPGIQRAAGLALPNTDPPLGIGSALVIDKHPGANKELLMLVPTMEIPCRLRTPYNVYWAFLALFYLTKSLPDDRIVIVPGMGTGTGGVDPSDMIDMMASAWYTICKYPVASQFYSKILSDKKRLLYVPDHHLILHNKSLNEIPMPQDMNMISSAL